MRTRFILSLVGILLLTSSVNTQDRPAVSFEQLTVAGTSVGLGATTVNPPGKPAAQYCTGIVETAEIRIRIDGTDPTSSVGALAQPGALIQLTGADSIRLFRAIRTGSSGAVPFTCYGVSPLTWNGALQIAPPPQATTTTGTGNEVHATSPTITTPTITTPTITDPTVTGTIAGASRFISGDTTATGRLFVREDFNRGFFVMENDGTAPALTDGAINIVFGVAGPGIWSFREEQTKTTTSWLTQAAGGLNIMGDNTTDNEGVEIAGYDGVTTTDGWLVSQTTGACFSVSITNTDISGTDQFLIGWRKAEAYVTDNVYTGYADWSVVGVNNVDGSIFSLGEVAGGGTLSDDSAVNMADGETRILKECISATGVPTAFYTAASGTTFSAITMTSSGTAKTAGIKLIPFITFLAAGTDGPSPIINWMQVEPLP